MWGEKIRHVPQKIGGGGEGSPLQPPETNTGKGMHAENKIVNCKFQSNPQAPLTPHSGRISCLPYLPISSLVSFGLTDSSLEPEQAIRF